MPCIDQAPAQDSKQATALLETQSPSVNQWGHTVPKAAHRATAHSLVAPGEGTPPMGPQVHHPAAAPACSSCPQALRGHWEMGKACLPLAGSLRVFVK